MWIFTAVFNRANGGSLPAPVNKQSGLASRFSGLVMYVFVCLPATGQMSPAERKKLMKGLETLTGLREGPEKALPDGTRYSTTHPEKNCGDYTVRGAIPRDFG